MKTKQITRMALIVTIAVLLGYIETLFPPIIPVPGIKLGIANAVITVVLYIYSVKKTWATAILKVLLCSLLFGSPMSFIYSASGAAVSLIIMTAAKRSRLFSVVGVSSLGGIFHNLAQLLCAYFFIGKGALLYIPLLCLSGAVCGFFTGIASQLIIKRGKNIFGKE